MKGKKQKRNRRTWLTACFSQVEEMGERLGLGTELVSPKGEEKY